MTIDCPPCAYCREPTVFAACEPHPALKRGWEMLSFACPTCGRKTYRSKAPAEHLDPSADIDAASPSSLRH